MTALEETSDEAARYALFADAQRILADDAVNGFLFQLAKHGAWKADIIGLWHNFAGAGQRRDPGLLARELGDRRPEPIFALGTVQGSEVRRAARSAPRSESAR